MDLRLRKVLEGCGANYIMPFFWQHGEEEAVLREEMQHIHESGIGAVCVEARPHPDFGGPLWWRDMDIIMDEAKKRGVIGDAVHIPEEFRHGTCAAHGFKRNSAKYRQCCNTGIGKRIILNENGRILLKYANQILNTLMMPKPNYRI